MPRILVADDDPAQLNLRKLVLESAGHEVTVAFSPSEALRLLPGGWAKLVIVDLRFPNADGESDFREGLALIRGIREQGCQAPLMVLSGWPDELYGQPEERMVSRVMMKPVPTRELLAAISELV